MQDRGLRCAFYAGWGLTIDRGQVPSRRRKDVPLTALFAAAYLRAARYVSPVSGKPITLEEALDFLEDARHCEIQNTPGFVVTGIRRWKQPHLKAFLGAPNRGNRLTFVWDFEPALKLAKEQNLPLVSWAAKTTDVMVDQVKQAGVNLLLSKTALSVPSAWARITKCPIRLFSTTAASITTRIVPAKSSIF